MASEQRFILKPELFFCYLYEAVSLRCHVEGYAFHVRGSGAVLFHHARIRREVRDMRCRPSRIQVIYMAFLSCIRVRRKDQLRLYIANGFRDALKHVLVVIETSVGQVQKAHIRHSQHFR